MIDLKDIHQFPKGERCHLAERVTNPEDVIEELNRTHPLFEFTYVGEDVFVRPLTDDEAAKVLRIAELERQVADAEARAAAAEGFINPAVIDEMVPFGESEFVQTMEYFADHPVAGLPAISTASRADPIYPPSTEDAIDALAAITQPPDTALEASESAADVPDAPKSRNKGGRPKKETT